MTTKTVKGPFTKIKSITFDNDCNVIEIVSKENNYCPTDQSFAYMASVRYASGTISRITICSKSCKVISVIEKEEFKTFLEKLPTASEIESIKDSTNPTRKMLTQLMIYNWFKYLN